MSDASPRSRFSRRTLLRLAGFGVGAAVFSEALRVFAFTNRHTVVPGKVYRTAQLTGGQLSEFLREKEIRTVINLRGVGPAMPWYQAECKATHDANVSQEDITLSAKRLPPPAEVQRLVEVLDNTEYPVVFHCQRGADRTGLAVTSYMLLQPGVTLDEARHHLSPRFGHVRAGRTVVIDEFFDLYEEWLTSQGRTHEPDLFRNWIANHYVPGQYRAEIELLSPSDLRIPVGQGFVLNIRATNRSIRPWEFKPGPAGGVYLRYVLYAAIGQVLYEGRAGMMRATLPPGGHRDFAAAFPPVKAPGNYPAGFDFRDAQAIDLLDSDFASYGSEPKIMVLTAV